MRHRHRRQIRRNLSRIRQRRNEGRGQNSRVSQTVPRPCTGNGIYSRERHHDNGSTRRRAGRNALVNVRLLMSSDHKRGMTRHNGRIRGHTSPIAHNRYVSGSHRNNGDYTNAETVHGSARRHQRRQQIVHRGQHQEGSERLRMRGRNTRNTRRHRNGRLFNTPPVHILGVSVLQLFERGVAYLFRPSSGH